MLRACFDCGQTLERYMSLSAAQVQALMLLSGFTCASTSDILLKRHFDQLLVTVENIVNNKEPRLLAQQPSEGAVKIVEDKEMKSGDIDTALGTNCIPQERPSLGITEVLHVDQQRTGPALTGVSRYVLVRNIPEPYGTKSNMLEWLSKNNIAGALGSSDVTIFTSSSKRSHCIVGLRYNNIHSASAAVRTLQSLSLGNVSVTAEYCEGYPSKAVNFLNIPRNISKSAIQAALRSHCVDGVLENIDLTLSSSSKSYSGVALFSDVTDAVRVVREGITLKSVDGRNVEEIVIQGKFSSVGTLSAVQSNESSKVESVTAQHSNDDKTKCRNTAAHPPLPGRGTEQTGNGAISSGNENLRVLQVSGVAEGELDRVESLCKRAGDCARLASIKDGKHSMVDIQFRLARHAQQVYPRVVDSFRHGAVVLKDAAEYRKERQMLTSSTTQHAGNAMPHRDPARIPQEKLRSGDPPVENSQQLVERDKPAETGVCSGVAGSETRSLSEKDHSPQESCGDVLPVDKNATDGAKKCTYRYPFDSVLSAPFHTLLFLVWCHSCAPH